MVSRNVLERFVLCFHDTFEQANPQTPTHMGPVQTELRRRLLDEEANREYFRHMSSYQYSHESPAQHDKCFVAMVDDLLDIVYVSIGTLVAMGVNFSAAFEEVALSNLSKAGEDGKAIKDGYGKVLKGPAYFKPDLESFVGPIRDSNSGT